MRHASDGVLIYGDREVTFTGLPEALVGAETVVTACDSKYTSGTLAECVAKTDITVYVAMDTRVTSLPAWLSGWAQTDLRFSSTGDVEYLCYAKDFAAGETVTLGENGQSAGCMNYIVLASNVSELNVRGDINADGEFSVADLVILQKWLLGAPDTELADWKAGDLCEDGGLDTFDLVAMRKELSSALGEFI